MRKTLTVGLMVVAAAVMTRTASAGSKLALAGDGIAVTFSEATGQIEGISDRTGARITIGCEDRYNLDGKTSVEPEDTVVSQRAEKAKVSFECVNKKLGLKISKEYRLNNGVLEKETKYLGEKADKLLFKLSSRDRLEPGLFKDGYYYTATDDGWKVYSTPFIPGSSITEPAGWTVTMGSFVYYLPKSDRVFTHYRYKVDGHYFYGDQSDYSNCAVESQFIPGGAITSIGLAFINDQVGITFESRYALLDGDASDYHRYIHNQPPFTDYRSHKMPTWFSHCRMFISNAGAEMQGLMENRDATLKDIADFMKLLKDDEYLMVFFNHWTMEGDFPYEGSFRYYDWTKREYSTPVPIERLKETFKMIQAISPRIKIGGYATFGPTLGSPPYDQHKDWMTYDKDGNVVNGSDGTAVSGCADFSSGYREYLLNQFSHYLTDLGYTWIHIDYGPFETANWKTRNVVQVYEHAKFYDELLKMFEQHDAAIIQNVAPDVGMWAHGGYFECQQPDRWEKKDWRILAVNGWLGILYRTDRPGAWLNLCYGTRDEYGIRNAQTGMRGWIRNGITWWRDVSRSLAHENVIDEMLTMRLSDIRVSPSWWKLQTDKLELDPLQKGETLVIPVLLHGDKASEEEISLNTADLNRKKGDCLFSFDLQLSSSAALDVFKPVPWKLEYMQAIGFNVLQNPPAKYTHRMKLEPLHNYYHILSGVPGWVYTANGARTAFLLPENAGVKITGSLPAGASAYDLSVQNSGDDDAQILAYLPGTWKGVKAEMNGQEAKPALVEFLGGRFILMDLAKGESAVRISDARTSNLDALTKVAYANPSCDFWIETSHRLFYNNLNHLAYQEDGKSCLALKEITPSAGGSVDFFMTQGEKAGGFSIAIKGQNSGGKAVVLLSAGENWTYEIKDDFTGWKEFNISRDQMTPATTVRKWAETGSMSLRVYPAGGREMSIADLHLLPGREGDFVKVAEVKRKLTVYRAKTPPVMDGFGKSACWQGAQVATDFFKFESEKLSESKSLVQVCYDDENLYIFFTNLEPISKLPDSKTLTKWGVFSSDHCHFFIDPYRDNINYYEIGVDASGAVADIRNSATGADEVWCGKYEVKIGLNYNVGWTMEMKLPFKNFGKTPKAGDVWGLTFARIDNTKEFSVWTAGLFGDPRSFGEMLFSGEAK